MIDSDVASPARRSCVTVDARHRLCSGCTKAPLPLPPPCVCQRRGNLDASVPIPHRRHVSAAVSDSARIHTLRCIITDSHDNEYGGMKGRNVVSQTSVIYFDN